MKGRLKRAILVLCGVIAVAAILELLLRPQEPVHQGKPLSYWLDEVNRAGSLDNTVRSSTAIRAIGTNSLPFLLSHIQSGPSPVKQFLAKLALKQSLVKLTFLESDPLCQPSLWAIRQLGVDAKPLIPDLIKLLDDRDRSWCGEMGLWAIGPETKPALVSVCQSTDERVRATAALLLARLVVNDGWSWGWNKSPVSGRIRFGLGSVVTDEVVDALRSNLNHADVPVRRASAEALKELGRHANRAVPELLVALKAEDPVVRKAAADALRKIAPDADPKAGVE